jgi:hypothetical protein
MHGTSSGYTNYGCRCALCREAERLYMQGWRSRNPDKWRNIVLRRKYNTNTEALKTLLALQGGGCAICKRRLDLAKPMVAQPDHNHKTDKLRGVLCRTCNAALGMFGDDPARLREAAGYLERATG